MIPKKHIKPNKTYVNLPVRPDTHEDVLGFKFTFKVKNIDEVIKRAMKELRKLKR